MASSSETPPFHWQYADLDDTTTTAATTYQLRGRTLFYVVILFAIILVASLLFFYTRWVCSTTRHHSPYSSSAAANGVDRQRRGGLDANVISALPVLLYGSESVEAGGDQECCICLSLFEEDEKVKVLPECSHCFHSDCVDRWLVSQSSCPLCRSPLTFHQQPADVSPRIVID